MTALDLDAIAAIPLSGFTDYDTGEELISLTVSERDALFAEVRRLQADAERLEWLEWISNEAIELEAFVGGNDPTRDAYFIDWAGEQCPSRISQGHNIREAIDAGAKKYPLTPPPEPTR